jgi:glycosyl hydrolase family 62
MRVSPRRSLSGRTRPGIFAASALLAGSALVALAPGGAFASAGPHQTAAHHPRHGLPPSFQWSSSGVLISPKPDSTHAIVSVKDPSVVRFRHRWVVYATTANTAGNWSLVEMDFRRWSQAAAAPQHFLDTNPNIGTGYRAAPEVFYFAPQHKWYLVYQTGLPSYSTSDNPLDPQSWSAPKNFLDAMPPIIAGNIGSGFWVDMWVICDHVNCYLFSSDDNGHLYRSQTTVADFPNGFGNTVIALQDPNRFSLFEASNVYKVSGGHEYLLDVEAIGSDGRRYFRSWTSPALDGQWAPLADTEADPFIRSDNVTFAPGVSPWTDDFSHGEMIRASNDQHLVINPCHLRFLYQGEDPAASGPYSQLPWRLGLLTQTNPAC